RDGGIADEEASLLRRHHPGVAVEIDDSPLAHDGTNRSRASPSLQLTGNFPSLRHLGAPLAVRRITVGFSLARSETESRQYFEKSSSAPSRNSKSLSAPCLYSSAAM